MNRVVWLFGCPAVGKTTIAEQMQQMHWSRNKARCFVLDADRVRQSINSDLTFTTLDRLKNVRRLAGFAQVLRQEMDVVVTAVTPLVIHREMVRTIIPDVRFVQVNCSLQKRQERDPKALYKVAAVKRNSPRPVNLTGYDAPFEYAEPEEQVFKVSTEVDAIEVSAAEALRCLIE